MTPAMRRSSTDDRLLLARPVTADEHGLGLQDRLAEDREPLAAQRRARLDDVGDDVGDAEGDGGLDRPVEAHDLAGETPGSEVGADEARIARRHPLAVDVVDRGHLAGAGGIPEGRAPEAERHHLDRGGAGVEQQVATGDAAVDGAGADVDGDVAGAQVEELDVVLDVGDDELLGVAAGAVARLAKHLDGGVGQGALVGHGNSQHGGGVLWGLTGGRRRRRA